MIIYNILCVYKKVELMMEVKKIFIAFILTSVLILSMFGEQFKPRIAVLLFNPIGVSKNDVQVVTGLFETGLVKTESFNVIEQRQINEILAAQAFTLTGCTDDACAIEFGKLLAAEQIVLGDLSSLGGKFILNVKIIDVELGRNIKADSVETSKLSEMTGAAELLAFKLAGLTYTEGQTVQIARDFRDVFIETDPSGADIYINGVKKGISPVLLEQVPLGNIIIEAEKDYLYGYIDSLITEKTNSLNIRLKKTYGNLLIKSTIKEIGVYLNGNLLGELGTGFFPDITVGEHSLVLDGSGYLWEGVISVIAKKSTTVEAEPRAYGVLSYNFPNGVNAELVNVAGFVQNLSGSGYINLWTGEYIVKLSGDDYEAEEHFVTINRAARFVFSPDLKHSREYNTHTRLAEIRMRRHEIEAEIARINRMNGNKDIGGWISAGTGVISAGLFGLFSAFSNSAYDDYVTATITADAVEYKEKVQLWDTLSYISLGTATAGAGLSAYLFLSKSHIEELNREYVSLGIEMARLEGELQ
jgi:hypothetical protein